MFAVKHPTRRHVQEPPVCHCSVVTSQSFCEPALAQVLVSTSQVMRFGTTRLCLRALGNHWGPKRPRPVPDPNNVL
eukprot:2369418-Heterocapsa_arctica.AAC.1